MSSKNVELVRRIYDRWAEGDFRAGRELLDPNITTVWAQEFPTAGVYHGPDRHAAAMREWLSACGAEVERRWAHVWTLHNGRVVRFEVHLDVGDALRAVEPRESP